MQKDFFFFFLSIIKSFKTWSRLYGGACEIHRRKLKSQWIHLSLENKNCSKNIFSSLTNKSQLEIYKEMKVVNVFKVAFLLK